jgi:hypothetical protein
MTITIDSRVYNLNLDELSEAHKEMLNSFYQLLSSDEEIIQMIIYNTKARDPKLSLIADHQIFSPLEIFLIETTSKIKNKDQKMHKKSCCVCLCDIHDDEDSE